MTCARIDDAGAYVLGALEEHEAGDYAAHLHTCEECRTEVASLRPVVATLPLAAPVEVPPDALRSRIMTTVEAEAQLLQAAGPEADRAAAPAPQRRGPLAWLGALRPLPAAGLASALLALGVAAGVLIDSTGGLETRTVSAQVAARGATAELRLNGGNTELAVAGMPAPPPGRVYQVWLQRKGENPEPTHTLFNVRSDGEAVVRITESVADADRLLVTAEPSGGSIVPTSSPVLKAQLD